MKPWKTLATVVTAEGPLELRQRDDSEFLLVIGGRILMTSHERRSEERLATLACALLGPAPRILIGGLGMAYTLRAALDAMPADARIDVAELVPEVEQWCRGPLAVLTNNAVADPRAHDHPRRCLESDPQGREQHRTTRSSSISTKVRTRRASAATIGSTVRVHSTVRPVHSSPAACSRCGPKIPMTPSCGVCVVPVTRCTSIDPERLASTSFIWR